MKLLCGISHFLNSWPGTYIVQSCVHSLIAAVIVDRALAIWNITSPLVQQRFRLVIIVLPIFSWPLYQLMDPGRGAAAFRLGSVLDSGRWLYLELWGKVPLYPAFILVLGVTTLIFFAQEMIPVVRHSLESGKSEITGDVPEAGSAAAQAAERLSAEKTDIFILDDEEYLLFSTTGRNAAIFLSRGLMDVLTPEQMEAAIAHEAAHIARNRRPMLITVFLLRVLMFFNPVVLLEFRKIVQEEEKICDDIAVSLTKKPEALAETLRKFYHETGDGEPVKPSGLPGMGRSLEEFSHNLHLSSRVARLENGLPPGRDGEWFGFTLTLAAILVINYFVV